MVSPPTRTRTRTAPNERNVRYGSLADIDKGYQGCPLCPRKRTRGEPAQRVHYVPTPDLSSCAIPFSASSLMKSVSRATKTSSIFMLNGGCANCSRLRTNTLHELGGAGEKRHCARLDELGQHLAGTDVLPSKDAYVSGRLIAGKERT